MYRRRAFLSLNMCDVAAQSSSTSACFDDPSVTMYNFPNSRLPRSWTLLTATLADPPPLFLHSLSGFLQFRAQFPVSPHRWHWSDACCPFPFGFPFPSASLRALDKECGIRTILFTVKVASSNRGILTSSQDGVFGRERTIAHARCTQYVRPSMPRRRIFACRALRRGNARLSRETGLMDRMTIPVPVDAFEKALCYIYN